ncbi:uncharacterized protein LOC126787578 [Argentina anserina]|uniref:uncharacterized protein LOC126787578 n=1 Tax=Argentina anserina TaxID=57926 RepID=UPI00217647F1|nr:uncharacterized protein LOC126787578 [Potentilla anserina]
MGTLIGHVIPGFGFVLIGLWHLFNHIKLHIQRPNSYTTPIWFPASKFKYLELLLIIIGSSASVAMELFVAPEKHQPFDNDRTIPSKHLHNFEDATISMTFLVYASFAIVLDKLAPRARHGLTQILGAIAFGQQLLLFHLQSTNHNRPEGQYHLLLQLVILVSFVPTLMRLGFPRSFLISFVRSLSIFFQSIWLMVMGFMLWTPELNSGFLYHLAKFHGLSRDDPNQHLTMFQFNCETMCPRRADIQIVKMRVFPYSSEDRVQKWLFEVPAGRVTSWTKMVNAFLSKYFHS